MWGKKGSPEGRTEGKKGCAKGKSKKGFPKGKTEGQKGCLKRRGNENPYIMSAGCKTLDDLEAKLVGHIAVLHARIVAWEQQKLTKMMELRGFLSQHLHGLS